MQANRAPSLFQRLGQAITVFRSGPGGGWHWPSNNGDRGPPGEWQSRGANASNDDMLLSFSAVYACIQIISGDCAKLPVIFYDIAPDGTRTINKSYPTNSLMRRPNGYQNGMQFMQSVLVSYLTTGNAYIYKVYDNRNLVRELHVLDPRSCWPAVTPDGSIYYRAGMNVLAGMPSGLMIPARDIGHIRLPYSPSMPLLGVSPVYAAASSSATGQRILYNSQKFFGNAARPGGFLTAPQRIDDETAKRIREDFDSSFGGERLGKTAVLGNGLDFKGLTMTSVDAQLIEQLKWSVEDVARVFRVPPFMIGDQGSTTYRNSEQLTRTYLNGCLSYHLSAIVSEFNSMFEFASTMTMEFDLDFLLRTEIDVRYAAYTNGLQAGWLSRNEVRRKEGLPDDEHGDDLLVQAQMRTLESIVEGTASEAGSVPGTPAPDDKPIPPNEPAPSEASAVSVFDKYRGVWDSEDYSKGDTVTHGGGVWLALRDTKQKPGNPDDVVKDWRLIVKSGTKGEPGKTPTLSVDDKGIVWAKIDGGEPTQIGDMRPLFQEIVEAALKAAKVSA